MLLALVAMFLDLLTGEPQRLYNKIGHPVSWMASLLMLLERHFNQPDFNSLTRKMLGVAALLLCLALCGSIAFLFESLATNFLSENSIAEVLVLALFASIFVAARSLFEHVMAVKTALEQGSLEASREAVGMIVGRQTEALDETAIARAATESLAENFSDGVVAPVFWLLVAGLPGIVTYKMVNTADSMVGYWSERFSDFGWASARLDDVLNLIPARLTALLILLSGFLLRIGRAKRTIHIAVRDSKLHASPNAGWPEAAMAGVLEARLGGPRQYSAVAQKEYAWLGKEFPIDKRPNLALALRLVKVSWGIIVVALALGGIL